MKKLVVVAMALMLSACGIGAGFWAGESSTSKSATHRYKGTQFFATDTQDAIRQKIGEPDRVDRRDGEEHWIYNRELGFSGPVIQVLLPLPLVVPVGYRHTTLVFVDARLDRVISERGGYNGFLCGMQNELAEFDCRSRSAL
jgi:hypothetical protein